MAKQEPLDLSDQIRAAVEESGLSMLAVCRGTGIDRGALSRFLNRKSGLRLESADRIVSFLGLRLVAKQRGGGRAKSKASKV